MYLNIILSVLTIVFGVLSQLFYKITLNHIGQFSFTWLFVASILTSKYFQFAIIFLIIQFFSWFYLLSRIPINVAMSITILIPALIILSGWLFLDESIPFMRWIGFLVMLCGLLLVIKTV